jgi:hypothetical protein
MIKKKGIAILKSIAAAALTGIIAGGCPLAGVESNDYVFAAKKISPPIKVDGVLSEPAWKDAPVIDWLVQREPLEGKPATERTEVRVLYDDDFLYIGFLCFDGEPDKIVANEMRRDADLESNDYVEVFIDSYHDSRNAFYFATNPLGAEFDALIRDEGAAINKDWDGIWLCRGGRGKDGWSAEIAIPFYTLRFKKADSQMWGINFGRHIARKKEEDYWTPILRDYGLFGKYRISFYGHLTGLKGLSQGKRIQVMPYVIGGGNKPDEESSFGVSGDAGLDLKYRLTSNVTADLTVNTDFAQVEADQEQFNLTRFDLFFPEKREFFLEGADIFRFGERFQEHEPPSTLLFFSRTIGLSEDGREIPIIGGVKVTGKSGRYDLGFLDIFTGRTSYREDEEQVDIQRTNFSVFRLKRDVFEKSSIGIIALSKDSGSGAHSDYNRAGGLDFSLAFGQNFQSGGFLAKTDTPAMKGDDWAGYLNFIWNSDLVMADVSYTDIGENFNSEMGFIPRTDIRKFRGNVGISPRPKFLGLRQSFIIDYFTYIENHAGQLESRNNLMGVFNLFQNGTQWFLGVMQNYEFLDEPFEIKEGVFIPTGGHTYDMFVTMFFSDKSRDFSLETEADFGGFYNGKFSSLRAQGNVKISKNFSLEFLYNRNQFDLPVEGGKFTTNIAGGRIVYSFTPGLYVKAYLQWNDAENLFKSNFLVRWIYKPGANIYFIYNESRKVGARGYVQDRAFMLKASFLFNY